MKIDKHKISPSNKPFIIAEMSGNHNRSIKNALNLIKIASEAGVDAIKLQTYKPETITLNSSRKDFYIRDKRSLWNGKKLFDLYDEAHTPWEWHEEIFEKAKELNLICFSSAFDESSVDFLETLNVPAYKIASFEINHIPLIKKIAKTKKPVILSSGVANLSDLNLATHTLKSNGCKDFAILKCTSNYPADPIDSNLKSIPKIKKIFNCEVGLSDHTLGIGTAIAAIAFGASIIEKHFTIKRSLGGVDSTFSLEPKELELLVRESHQAWQSLGSEKLFLNPLNKNSSNFKRSIFIKKNLNKNDILDLDSVGIFRPSTGMHPKYFDKILGKKVNKNLKIGMPFKREYIKK